MVSLSQKLVDALPLDADGVTWDDDTPGLGLRVQRGKRSWVVRYRVAGVQRQKTLPGGLKLAKARDQANALRTAATVDGVDRVAEGRAAAAAKRKAELEERSRRQRQLSKLVEAYLTDAEANTLPGERRKPLAESTLVELRRYLREAWKPLHDHDPEQLDRATIIAELKRIKQERGPIASNRARAYLGACLSYGVEMGLLTRNAVVGTKPLAPKVARERLLTDGEIREVWLETDPATDYGTIVRLLLLLGQRREEVGGMQRPELDLDRALWRLPGGRTKNGLPHDVPLPRQAAALIKAVPVRDEKRTLVFGEGEGPFSGWSQSKARLDHKIARRRAEARLGRPLAKEEKPEPSDSPTPWTLHDLRRTVVTGMAEIGIAPHIIEAVVNHISGHKGGVAGVYNRAKYSEEKRSALQRWADHVDHIVAGRPDSNIVPFRETANAL